MTCNELGRHFVWLCAFFYLFIILGSREVGCFVLNGMVIPTSERKMFMLMVWDIAMREVDCVLLHYDPLCSVFE